jgi:hypothetical protein
VSLQEGARTLNPDNGLPAKGTVPIVERPPPSNPALLQALEDANKAGEVLSEEKLQELSKRPMPESSAGAKAKKAKTSTNKTGSYSKKVGGGSPWVSHKTPYGYRDIVWTPELQEQHDKEVRNESRLVWALYEAIQNRGSNNVQIAQLGSDWKVNQLKKDPQFKNLKLIDLLSQYDDVFAVLSGDEAAAKAGAVVSLKAGSEQHLPEPDEILSLELNEKNQLELQLPPRIHDPVGVHAKMQAIRIDILHLLCQRGHKLLVQELGQDPQIQKKKQGVNQAKKIQDLIKIFPSNFTLTVEDGMLYVTAINASVEDQSMITNSIQQSHANLEANRERWRQGKGGQARSSSSQYRSSAAAALPAGLVSPLTTGASLGYSPEVFAAAQLQQQALANPALAASLGVNYSLALAGVGAGTLL